MNNMTKLMEHSFNLIVSEKRAIAKLRKEITVKVCDGKLNRSIGFDESVNRRIHPCARSLASTRIQIRIDPSDDISLFHDLKKSHAVTPHWNIRLFPKFDSIDAP